MKAVSSTIASSVSGSSSSAGAAHKNLDKFKRIMDHVYGEFTTASTWKPKLYREYTTGGGGGGRYLWTDAFGVINYITLFCETNDAQYLDQADALIHQVHEILGRERITDTVSNNSPPPRRLGAATDEQPTLGGLRIGKNADEDSDDGDGQYFHYLTKWMYCLNRMSIARNNEQYNQWAIDLAKSIHPAFVYHPSGGSLGSRSTRMFWKMSIDLKTPLVRSEGNLDPFDGYVTYRILQDTANEKVSSSSSGVSSVSSSGGGDTALSGGGGGVLEREIHDMRQMVDTKYPHYASNDPLDLGEALWISHWYHDEIWSHHISKESLSSINELWTHGYFRSRSYYRLAFREFGTTIGVQVNPIVQRKSGNEWITSRVPMLHSFWERDLFSRDSNITPVMYCSSLIPGAWRRGYVEEHMNKQRSES